MKVPNSLRPQRFGLKMFFVALPIIMAFSALVILLGSSERRKQSFETAADKAHVIAHMTTFGLGPALFFEDSHTIEEVVQSAKQNKDLSYIVVLNASGHAVAEFNSLAVPHADAPSAVASENGYFSADDETYHLAAPVLYTDRQVGSLYLGLSLRDALRAAAIYRGKLVLAGLGLLIAGLAAVYFLSMAITKPLRRVSETAREIARGDMTKRAPVSTFDESGQLAVAFNTMVDALAESRATLENRVEQRTRELQSEVTERRRVESALRESEENFRSMLESLGEGVGLVSATEEFLFANRSAAAIFGLPESELAGRNLREFTDPGNFETIRAQTARRREGERGSYELDIRRPDGVRRTILLTAIPRFKPGGDYLGALSVFADISDRKRDERELSDANDKLHGTVLVLERRNTEISLLSELYEAFQACRKEEELYETAGRYAMKLFPDDSGALYIFKESRNLLDAVTVWGPGERVADVLVPDDCWALRRGKVHLADEAGSSPICPHVHAHGGAPPYVCVPLAGRGETFGLLHVRFRGGPVPDDGRSGRAKPQLAQNFAERISLALDNFKLWARLLQQSIRDPLTGLFNRRFMEVTLERELARSERNGASLGVIMLDIDKFKDFNDSFGHEAGDEMLKAIGAFLPAHVRKEDVVCRYGGEEFIIILPGASLEASADRARKVCREIRPLRVEHERTPLGPISFSLGVAAFPMHGSTGMAVVQAADMALLRAKKEGRARVVVAE
jgi:diguanylate cyclase (GGDEF)-like protein/PAS domain S-box-containing protein